MVDAFSKAIALCKTDLNEVLREFRHLEKEVKKMEKANDSKEEVDEFRDSWKELGERIRTLEHGVQSFYTVFEFHNGVERRLEVELDLVKRKRALQSEHEVLVLYSKRRRIIKYQSDIEELTGRQKKLQQELLVLQQQLLQLDGCPLCGATETQPIVSLCEPLTEGKDAAYSLRVLLSGSNQPIE